MKVVLLIWFVVFLLVPGAMLRATDAIPKALSKTEVRFLESLRAVKIGMSESELRGLFPDLGVPLKPESRHDDRESLAVVPAFQLVGLEWDGYAEFRAGKLVRILLFADTDSEPVENKRQAIPRHEVRKAGLLIANHFQRSVGEVTERYVPDVDCPAGNPYGLRHTWRTKGKALLVGFGKVSSAAAYPSRSPTGMKYSERAKSYTWTLGR